MTNVRDVEVSEKFFREKVLAYLDDHGIKVLLVHTRNRIFYARLNFPPGTYAPFHREYGFWDVKLA
jgi:hypothetical protein